MENIDVGLPNIGYQCFKNIDDIDITDVLKSSMLTSMFVHL